ncbi:TPA: hypothetical protein SMT94_001932 [Proteus mirabilis]
MKKLLIVTALSLFLVGCGGDPKLDMTTEDTAKATMTEMRKNLSPEDDAKLQKTLAKISMQAAFVAGNDKDELKKLLMEKVNGKTAQEIIEMGEKK